MSLVVILGSIASFVPLAPSFPTTDIDSAWSYALNEALSRRFVFGRDIVFTFGPYAAVYSGQYHPATDMPMLWASGLMGLAFAGGLICLSSNRYKVSAILLLVFIELLARDVIFFGIPLVFLLLICRMMTPDSTRLVSTPSDQCTYHWPCWWSR